MQQRAAIPILLAAVILVVMGFGAVNRNGTTELEEKMSITFQVGPMVNGSFQSIGTLTFDAAGAGVLELTGSGEEAEKLRAAWEETAAKDKLSVRRTRRVKDADGNAVTEFIGVTVKRGGDGYPQAVIDYLSNEYGYFARPAT